MTEMSHEKRQERISLLSRQNRGKTDHPYYLSELSHVIRRPLIQDDVLELQETDKLVSEFLKHVQHTQTDSGWPAKHVFDYSPKGQPGAVCICLAEKLGLESSVLFAGPYEYCGGVRIPVQDALLSVDALLEFDRNAVRLQSLTSDTGLYLDLYEEGGNWFLEMDGWGSWGEALVACLAGH